MATTKYEKQYQEMIERNKQVFEDLQKFGKKRKSEEFREVQFKAMRIVKRNEDALCSKTENNKRFSSFSTSLSDKFWEKIRSEYPEIDYSFE